MAVYLGKVKRRLIYKENVSMKKILLALSLMIACIACVFAAACADGTYTYSFNTNGGTAIENVEVESGQSYTLPTPEREGYGFEGWYLTDDFSGDPVTIVSEADGDKTFYAKWEQLPAITLDLGGGTLAEGTTLYLAEGSVVYDFMQDYVPSMSGLTFGAWFYNGEELGRNVRMPAEGIALEARYKVGYTIEVYTQNETLDGYEMTNTVDGSGYVGAEVTAEHEETGYVGVDNEAAVTDLTLSATASSNVFKMYFDRETYTITFIPNYPDGTAGTPVTVDGKYGIAIDLPYDYSFGGYLLSGWATSASGDAEYELDYIDYLTFNSESDTEYQPTQYVPTRNVALYGVWNRGYTDMFGGGDSIFLFENTDEDGDVTYSIYLNRGGVYFKGECSDAQNFMFDVSEDVLLEGRINADGTTFSYYSADRDSLFATLFVSGEGLQNGIQLQFDAYNGVSYVTGEPSERSDGTYTIDEDGYYHITFGDTGAMAGQTIVVLIGYVTEGATSEPAFQIRNEAEVALGAITRYAVNSSGIVYYTNGIYSITLNGFGTAYYNTGEEEPTTFNYTMNDDGTEITLTSGSSVAGVARIVRFGANNETIGYMLYDETVDAVYTAADGSTLTLDGVYNATYTSGGTTVTGYYYVSGTSVFGGNIISVLGDGSETSFTGTKTFIVESETTEVGEGDEAESVTTYSFEEKAQGYAEYYYSYDASGTVYYAPLIVINDNGAGTASLYGFNTTTREFELVSTGSYTYNENSGLYTYTAEDFYEADVSTELHDISAIQNIVFGTGTTVISSNSYSVNFWYSALIVGEDGQAVNEDYAVEYAASSGTLTLAGGFAVLVNNGERYVGAYTVDEDNENLITIAAISGNTITYVYVELGENNTYLVLDSAPYTANALLADGTASSAVTLAFDGKGGAVYTAGEGATPVSGTVTRTSQTTEAGYYVFLFEGTDGSSFNFIQISVSSAIYFSIYNEEVNGVYTSSTYGRLVLDGYGLSATYYSAEGYVTGTYSISEEDGLILYTQTGYMYFDLGADRSFTVKGEEYGNYLLMDNQYTSGVYLSMDGYGRLAVFTISLDENGETVTDAEGNAVRNYIDDDGTYVNDNGRFTLTYQDGVQTITIYGTTDVYMISSTSGINIFVVEITEIVRTYIDPSDWSVLVLDAYGHVTRYNQEGVVETGDYVVITDELVYFATDDGNDAAIYKYDTETGIINAVSLLDRGYYTKDLESLRFTRYGFAIFNGTTRYYYNIEDDGSVVIYQQDPENEQANSYGFVSTNFPEFTNQIVYEGKTYYRNSGFTLSFSRDTATSNLYPVGVITSSSEEATKHPLEELRFTPSGSAEFSVAAQVLINGTWFSGTVTRVSNTEGGYDMYLDMITSGTTYFRFDIAIEYLGEDETGLSLSTYEITSMTLHQPATSSYYQTLYYLSLLLGSSVPENIYGEIVLLGVYDENGDMTSQSFSAWFAEDSGMNYPNGEPITFENVQYTYNEKTGAYETPVDMGDEYSYTFCFTLSQGLIGYAYEYALVRNQSLVDEATGITVNVSRVVNGNGYTAGDIFSIELVQNGEVIPVYTLGYINDELYYIYRELDDNGRITATTYYRVVLSDTTGGSVEDPEDEIVLPYLSVKLIVEEMTTYTTADGSTYVDIDAQNNVRLIKLGTSLYVPGETVYDQATNSYTITLSATVKYTITVNEDGTITVTEVVAEEEEQTNE